MRSPNALKVSVRIVVDSYRLLFRHPVLVVPMMVFWAFWASIVCLWNLELRHRVPSLDAQLTLIFVLILAGSVVLTAAGLCILEMLEQKERGGRIDLGAAALRACTVDAVRALPIMLGFAVLWFLLNLLAVLASPLRGRRGLSAQNARRELTEGSVPWFRYAHKLLRMLVFTFLPAIAWEGRWAPAAVARGFSVIKNQAWRFVAGFFALEAAMLLMFLPLELVLRELKESGLHVPPWGDWLIIIYVGIVASTTLFLEQIYVAELYLWHLRWEKAKIDAAREGRPIPDIAAIPKPSLLDEVPDLTRALTPS